VEAEQLPDGTVPVFVPTVPSKRWASPTPVAVWGDVAVLTPWVLYERFGDLDLVKNQYASAKAWVDRVASAAREDRLWNDGFQLGDWLDPAAPPDDPAAARADGHLVATAYFAESAKVLSYMAMALKRDDDADQYAKLAAHAARAFVRRWVRSNGLLENEAQTSYALAIQFDLIPGKATRLAAGRRLAELVRAEGHRIGTGFAGTPLICDALCSVGHYDTAYRLLLQQECPSWLYPVTQGATTTWERWDSLLPDGTVNPGQMTSFNHYALGAVADWLHRTVAGLGPAEPGYRRLLVRPRPGGGLTHASAAHETPYGRAEVRWHRDNGELEVDVLVPPGTTATIDLPGGQPPFSVSAGRHRIALGEYARIRTTTMESGKP
jgi:alpha-L-rhamnosidase